MNILRIQVPTEYLEDITFFREGVGMNCATLKAVQTFVIDQWEQSDR